MNTFQSSDYWTDVARYDTMSDTEKQYYIYITRHLLYRLNADRFYWNSGDLQNLAEAFFAMGNVASICRICFLLPIIPFVGPLQVKIKERIIKHLIRLCITKTELERNNVGVRIKKEMRIGRLFPKL